MNVRNLPLLTALPALALLFGLTLISSPTVYAVDEAAPAREDRDFDKMTPSGTIEFELTSVKVIAGGSWGDGTLDYKGQKHSFKVRGISGGGLGIQSMKVSGNVYSLARLEDFAGNYVGGTAGVTAGKKGLGGSVTYENPRNVVLRVKAIDRKGAQLNLSLEGLQISMGK